MRTTVDIDDPILRELKSIGQKEGKSLGRLISDLLADSLDRRKSERGPPPSPEWITQKMDARLNLADREAVYEAMEAKSHMPQDASRS